MTYATLTNLLNYATEAELAQLTTDDALAPDTEIIDSVLADSSAEVDSYLPSGVTVPEGSLVAARVVCFLTLYHLYSRSAGVLPNESRQTQFAAAQQWLFQLSMGAVTP